MEPKDESGFPACPVAPRVIFVGAEHPKTTFSEETIYLFTSYGPLAMYGPDGAIAGISDAEGWYRMLSKK